MPTIKVDIQEVGPVFNGDAEKAAHDFCIAAEAEIADVGVTEVKQALRGVLRHPTGYYESHIQTELVAETNVVTDGGVIYGPWLEGVGSRNSSSRFKGYSTFRKVKQALEAKAPDIAERILPPFLNRMNG
jgi:hypothetical protein